MDWSAFFTAAGLPGLDTVVAWQPSAVTGVAALVASAPLDTWKDYLRVRTIDRYADLLPNGFVTEALAMHDLYPAGKAPVVEGASPGCG